MPEDQYRENLLTADQYREIAKKSFTPFVFTDDGQTMPFRMAFPERLTPGKKYPLILLLHGAGSLGDDNVMQLFIGELYGRHPLSLRKKAFILLPQCPVTPHWIHHGSDWSGLYYTYSPTPTTSLQMVLDLLDYVADSFPVDIRRMAVGGNSMGGYGTWDLLSRRPGFFRAAFPICGGADPRRAADVRGTRLWFFHGARDLTVSPVCSRRMAEALSKADIPYTYTEFPEADHDAWTPALTMDDFHRWLNEALLCKP